jgi:hypothetical protein
MRRATYQLFRRSGPAEQPAQAGWIQRGYLGTLLRLILLTPGVVEASLDGRQPKGLGVPRLVEPFTLEWTD